MSHAPPPRREPSSASHEPHEHDAPARASPCASRVEIGARRGQRPVRTTTAPLGRPSRAAGATSGSEGCRRRPTTGSGPTAAGSHGAAEAASTAQVSRRRCEATRPRRAAVDEPRRPVTPTAVGVSGARAGGDRLRIGTARQARDRTGSEARGERPASVTPEATRRPLARRARPRPGAAPGRTAQRSATEPRARIGLSRCRSEPARLRGAVAGAATRGGSRRCGGLLASAPAAALVTPARRLAAVCAGRGGRNDKRVEVAVRVGGRADAQVDVRGSHARASPTGRLRPTDGALGDPSRRGVTAIEPRWTSVTE